MNDWQACKDATEKRLLYYNSREWNLKKKAIHHRAGNICERCKINRLDIVHHLTYRRLYNEPLEDLMGLCRVCNDFIEARADFDPLHVYRHSLPKFIIIEPCEGDIARMHEPPDEYYYEESVAERKERKFEKQWREHLLMLYQGGFLDWQIKGHPLDISKLPDYIGWSIERGFYMIDEKLFAKL